MQTDDEAVLKLTFTNIKVFVKAVLRTAFYISLFSEYLFIIYIQRSIINHMKKCKLENITKNKWAK